MAVGDDYTEALSRIQAEIREIDDARQKLHRRRAQLIREAKDRGLSNRQVAEALEIHETHVYRITKP